MNLILDFSLTHCYQAESLKLFDKFYVTSSFKLNSRSENNNENKNESQLFHCYESGF